MADKGFILTVVAVLAVAILAGGLRNSYSGALTRSYEQPGLGQGGGDEPYMGFSNYRGGQQPLPPYQRAVKECRQMYEQGELPDYTDYRNCVEIAAKSNLRRR
ncbi:MAG: hypothetical protein AABY07_08495 [Nanoarchaeota archaeon]